MRQVIAQENLSWLQVWEPTRQADSVRPLGQIAAAYNVWGIPRTVLIDRAGKIVAKDLRGEALIDRHSAR